MPPPRLGIKVEIPGVEEFTNAILSGDANLAAADEV